MYRYREREHDDSSDTDDDNLAASLKRQRPKTDSFGPASVMDLEENHSEQSFENNLKKRKVNNIWSSVAQEQTLNDNMCKVNMQKMGDRLGVERGCESYDFTRKMFDPRPDTDTDEEIDLDYGVGDIENEFKTSELNLPGTQNQPKKKSNPKVVFVERLEDAERIGREVARKLGEPKPELIARCAQVLGRKKVYDLFHMTEDIEENGGMLIMNGSRRRTPGGVFFYLIRKDKCIDKRKTSYIFAEDKEKHLEMKKAQRKMKDKKRNENRLRRKAAQMEIEASQAKEDDSNLQKELNCTISPTNTETENQNVQLDNCDRTSDIELEEGEIL